MALLLYKVHECQSFTRLPRTHFLKGARFTVTKQSVEIIYGWYSLVITYFGDLDWTMKGNFEKT